MAIKMMKFSLVYFFIGVLMGMGMSMADNHLLTPVHVHINLLGWVSLAIGGLMYHTFKDAEKSKWGKVHYWTHMIGIPLMMGGITLALLLPVEKLGLILALIPLGGVLIVVGTFCFLINGLRNFHG
ncbi:MAG: cytochrome-c oxidase [Neobacillus sp.]